MSTKMFIDFWSYLKKKNGSISPSAMTSLDNDYDTDYPSAPSEVYSTADLRRHMPTRLELHSHHISSKINAELNAKSKGKTNPKTQPSSPTSFRSSSSSISSTVWSFFSSKKTSSYPHQDATSLRSKKSPKSLPTSRRASAGQADQKVFLENPYTKSTKNKQPIGWASIKNDTTALSSKDKSIKNYASLPTSTKPLMMQTLFEDSGKFHKVTSKQEEDNSGISGQFMSSKNYNGVKSYISSKNFMSSKNTASAKNAVKIDCFKPSNRPMNCMGSELHIDTRQQYVDDDDDDDVDEQDRTEPSGLMYA